MTLYEQKLKLLRANLYKNQDQIKSIIAIRNYIDTNYDADLNMGLLSKMMRISKFHLIRLFKKYYGLTPRQYVINKRIEKSKENLRTGMTVTETCYAIGFSSVGSFSALFKTKTGKTPAEFRKEQFSRSKAALNMSSLN
jgi:AraC-like DNA-binding protein